MPKLLLSIVTYNSEAYIAECLKSFFSEEAQRAFANFQVVIVDNASSDATLERISALTLPVEIIRNRENRGFSGGHNQAFRLAKERGIPFVLIVNPDIVFTPSSIAEMLRTMEVDDRVASVGGKLLRASGEQRILDSTGLLMYKSGKTAERGSGEEDREQYNKEEEVFGISGALALYRMAALEDVKMDEEYFDEDFFAYKEDVDLAWRLRLFGWKAVYVPTAVAYHHRAVGSFGGNDLTIAEERRSRSPLASKWSYRNHFFTFLKNEQAINFFLRFPFILFFEARKFGYLLLFERRTLGGLVDFFRLLPKMMAKRKALKAKIFVSPKEIRKWLR